MNTLEKMARAAYADFAKHQRPDLPPQKIIPWDEAPQWARTQILSALQAALDVLYQPSHYMYLNGLMPETALHAPNKNCVEVFKRMICAVDHPDDDADVRAQLMSERSTK